MPVASIATTAPLGRPASHAAIDSGRLSTSASVGTSYRAITSFALDTSTPYTALLSSMIDLAKIKGAGAVNFRARYLAVHRRSELTVRSLIDVGAGRGNSSPVCPGISGRKAGHSSSAPALNT